MPNTALETRGWTEVLNATYGMGRQTASYHGRLLAFHGGDLPGFHTQVSFMPQDHVGVVVFEIGNHSQPLYNVVSYNPQERLLGLDRTPWSDRALEIGLKNKKRRQPRHGPRRTKAPLPVRRRLILWPVMKAIRKSRLRCDEHWTERQPTPVRLSQNAICYDRFHYDRFDTPDDEQDGKWSVNFRTNPQGDIDQAVMSLDEAEAVFVRRPDY